MHLWEWFCRLGTKKGQTGYPAFWRKKSGEEPQEKDGTEQFCTRLCGEGFCKCGSSVRGLYCIWSHYRQMQ